MRMDFTMRHTFHCSWWLINSDSCIISTKSSTTKYSTNKNIPNLSCSRDWIGLRIQLAPRIFDHFICFRLFISLREIDWKCIFTFHDRRYIIWDCKILYSHNVTGWSKMANLSVQNGHELAQKGLTSSSSMVSKIMCW